MKHVIQEERLKDFGLSDHKKRRSRADLVATFSYPTGEYRDDGDRLLLKMNKKKTRSKGHKLQQGKLQLDIRKKQVTMRAVKY